MNCSASFLWKSYLDDGINIFDKPFPVNNLENFMCISKLYIFSDEELDEEGLDDEEGEEAEDFDEEVSIQWYLSW